MFCRFNPAAKREAGENLARTRRCKSGVLIRIFEREKLSLNTKHAFGKTGKER